MELQILGYVFFALLMVIFMGIKVILFGGKDEKSNK